MECPSIIPRTSLKKCRASSVIRSAACSECDGGGGDRSPVARPSTPRGDATVIVANLWTASCEGRWSQRLGVLGGKLIAADLLHVLVHVLVDLEWWMVDFGLLFPAPAKVRPGRLALEMAPLASRAKIYGTSACPSLRYLRTCQKERSCPRKISSSCLNSSHKKNTKHIHHIHIFI